MAGREAAYGRRATLYFRLKDKPIVLACDRYDTVEANLAAIAAHIDAMRAMERHDVGATTGRPQH